MNPASLREAEGCWAKHFPKMRAFGPNLSLPVEVLDFIMKSGRSAPFFKKEKIVNKCCFIFKLYLNTLACSLWVFFFTADLCKEYFFLPYNINIGKIISGTYSQHIARYIASMFVIPAKTAKIKYIVPISFALVELNQFIFYIFLFPFFNVSIGIGFVLINFKGFY